MITLFNTYYNQEKMLKAQLVLWASYQSMVKDKIQFLIVDDCSQEHPALPICEEFKSMINLKLFRVKEDKYCNIGGSRNLGMIKTDTDWNIISDIDHVFPELIWSDIFKLPMDDPRWVYRFNRINMNTHELKQHPAIMLLHRLTYWSIGGCDEDFVGNYGFTDVHFRHRAEQWGVQYEDVNSFDTPSTLLQLYPEGETEGIDRSKLAPNQLLMQQKVQSGDWSTDYVRFEYEQQL